MQHLYSNYKALALLLLSLLFTSYATAGDTPITLYKSFEGNIAVTSIGNSELNETNGTGNCGDDTATSATLSLPAGATIKAAYLYWYAMTANITLGDNFSFGALSNSSDVTFPGYSGKIHKTRKLTSQKFSWGGYWKYSGHFADVTDQVSASPNGNYTVDIEGGASASACAYSEENVRAWNLTVVYDAPSLIENKKIYVYDGLTGYLEENITIPVSGFEVPTTSTAGALTVVSIQGDVGIPGEFMNTSDNSFPSFPADFANSDHGAALDIDTLSGNFTPGTTSININSGSNQDLIFTTNVILSIPTVPTYRCFAMTDDVAELYSFDLNPATAPSMVTTSMLINGEGATYRATDNAIYTFHQPIKGVTDPSDLYKVSLNGSVTLVKANFLSQQGVGAEFVRYSDGSEQLVVLQNQSVSSLLVFDAQNLTSNTPLSSVALLFPDGSTAAVAGLAVNPVSGEILVVDDSTDDTDYAEIYSVNIGTGQLTLKTTLTTAGVDAESLAFAEDGELYTENESKGLGTHRNKIFRVDLATGNLTAVEDNINTVVSGDIEGMSCTGSKIITTTNSTSLTLVAKITNNDGGASVVGDLGISSDAGTLTFNAGVNAGAINTFTANPLPIDAGSYQLSASEIANYTSANWSCSGGSSGFLLTNIFVEGSIQASISIPDGDNITCTISYDDDAVSACTGTLSGDINAGLSPVSTLKNGASLFLGSTNIDANAGHLKSYTIGPNGLPGGTVNWDAATAMNQSQRLIRLFSTADGNKTLFNAMPDEAFGSAGVPSNSTIKSNVASASLGMISPDSNLSLLDDKVNVMRYMGDPAYKTFYQDTISTRSSNAGATVPKLVLTSSDDGFLYAFQQSNGQLHWGWTPPSLVTKMRNAFGFPGQHYMQGVIDIMDIKDDSAYHSYVVGSYRDGLGQYVLKLNTDSTLNSVVWDTDHKESNTLAGSAPNQGKRAYFSDGANKQYMIYVITTTANDSVLHIRSITDTSIHYQIVLDFTATSTPFVMPKFKGTALGNTLFLGDNNGNIYAAPLLVTADNNLTSSASLTSALQAPVTALDSTNSSAVQFIGSTTSKTGNALYLRAQSENRLTLFMYQTSAGSPGWQRQWTTTIGSSGKWVNNSNTLTADASILPLPTGTTITDDAHVIANSIVLPVTLPPTGSNCVGDAYYYLYRTQDGHTPTKTFYRTSDNSAITDTVSLGKGLARRLHVAEHPGSKKLIGLGMSDQKLDGSVGVSASFYIVDPVATGMRSWRELH